MKRTLQPHQERDIPLLFKSLSKYGAALDGSDTGTGKSLKALRLCSQIGAIPAIVTRKSILPGWMDELAAENQEALFLTNYESAWRDGFKFTQADRKVVREAADGKPAKYKTTFRWRADQLPRRVVFIFDEVHGCRADTSINSQMLMQAAQHWKTLLLSATPFTTPLEAYPVGNALRIFGPKSWHRWLHHHGVTKAYGGGQVFVGDRMSYDPEQRQRYVEEGARIMRELGAEIFPEHGARTRRDEIPGFPETLVDSVLVDTGCAGEIEKAYLAEIEEARRMDVERVKLKLPEVLHSIAEAAPITVNLRSRQEAELLKIPVFEEMAVNARLQGFSVIVYLNFDRSIEALAARLKTACIIRGATNSSREEFAQRHNYLRNFQRNNEPFIIVNSSANAGLNLHDNETQVPRYSVISSPWSAVALKQILGRPQRLGGGFSVQKIVFAKDTVEERVHDRVKSRIHFLDSLVDFDFRVDS